jgi:hypothetical protein
VVVGCSEDGFKIMVNFTAVRTQWPQTQKNKNEGNQIEKIMIIQQAVCSLFQ